MTSEDIALLCHCQSGECCALLCIERAYIAGLKRGAEIATQLWQAAKPGSDAEGRCGKIINRIQAEIVKVSEEI